MALRIANGVFLALFLLAVAVQYNDPDPLRWMAIYGAAALSCGLALARRLPRWLPWAVAAVALAWVLGWLPAALGRARPGELVERWEMRDARVEEAREAGGLLLVAGWMVVLGWARRRGGPPALSR